MSGRSLTVLVVEDEPLILLNASDIIEQAGMVALEAASASSALSILERNGDIDLVFSDIDLPGSMNGLDLARRVHERWPGIGLVLTSGHMLSRSIQVPESAVFLPKPYRAEVVVEALQGLSTRSQA